MNTDLLTKKIEQFFEKEGFDVRVKCGMDFCYEYASSTIYYSLITPKNAGEWHMKYSMRHGLKYDCGSFFMGLFHEVGHHFTLDDLEDDEEKFCRDVKARLNGESIEDNFIYFDLPDERLATEWAICYINNNRGKLMKLAIELQPIINSIYVEFKK